MKIKKTYFCFFFVTILLSFFTKSLAFDWPDVEDIEDVNLNTWITDYTPMPTGRNALASARYKDKIYCIGGYSGSRHNKVEVYDITNDSWSEVAEMPTKRSNFVAEQYNGKIYCIGGWNGAYYNMVEVYDIETNTWDTTKKPMPTSRRSMASCLWDGKIYVSGGINANGYVDTLEVYDIENDTWDTLASMPTPREGLSAQAYKNKLYFIGGKDNNYLNILEVYDIARNRWEESINMPTPRGYISSEIYAGKIYVVGGRNASTYMDKVEIYDIEDNTWSDGVSIPTKRDALITEIFRGKIYAIGGNNGSYRQEVEAYYIYEYPEDRAYKAIQTAKKTLLLEDISIARELTNKLEESVIKDIFQDMLNSLSTSNLLTPQVVSSNVDIYVKSENMLSMSLDTNLIMFDEYSGVADMEKLNALNLTIKSSLPYSLNAYLLSEISNNDGSNNMSLDIINIKEGMSTEYKKFLGVDNKLILKDNCLKGNNTHSIDLKLSSNKAHVADMYRTVIKFEAEQK